MLPSRAVAVNAFCAQRDRVSVEISQWTRFFAGRYDHDQAKNSKESAPAVHQVPPNRAQPLIQTRLGPLPVGPPARPELNLVMGAGDGKTAIRNLMAQDAERTVSVKI